MAIDAYHPDQRCEPGEAGRRAPPRCYTRPARRDATRASRSDDPDGNAHVLAFGIMLIVMWCISAFLILQNGWSF
jgi:hypothetical protein